MPSRLVLVALVSGLFLVGGHGCEQESTAPIGPADDEGERSAVLPVEDDSGEESDEGPQGTILGPQPGLWVESRREAWEDEVERLESLGYLQGYKKRSQKQNVTLHEDGAEPGLNLYSSGHAPEAVLMDMDGKVLHSWSAAFKTALPDYKMRKARRIDGQHFWMRVHLFPNGDLLAIFGGFALIKLDRRSKVLWTYTKRAHHDLEVQPDGSIYVLTRKARHLPRFGLDSPIVEDFVTVLDPDGNEQRSVSILGCFENSSFDSLIEERCIGQKDPLHTNTVEVLDGRFSHLDPAFGAGKVLISCRNFSTIAVLDLEARTVLWARSEGWRGQHHPSFLDSGDLLLFDNLGHDGEHGLSRILQFDPVSGEVHWSYAGTLLEPFQTDTAGFCQRLPGGTTLITESESGRAFEVTDDGSLVWEFINPHRAGPEDQLIAMLLEVKRLPADFPLDWLDP